MKIIQITPAYKPAYIYGGPTMSVAKLCETLQQFNNLSAEQLTLEVLTTTANGAKELEVDAGKQVAIDGVLVTYFKRITKDHTHFSPALLSALSKKITNKTIIHIHSWWNLVAIFSCLVGKLYKIPVVLSPRGMLTGYSLTNRNSFFKSSLHLLLGKSLLKYVHIIASSEQEKLDVLEIISPKSITIIPNLVSLPNKPETSSEEERSIDPEILNLLFLSRIEEKKGLDILFEALAILNFEWTLNIGGTGEESYIKMLREKAKTLKIDLSINWLGQINNRDKFKLMADHDLLVLTSHNENFANVVIESLSVGTPVLLSKNVGLSTYIKDNDLGFITSLSPKEIAKTILDAHMNTSKRSRIRLDAPTIIDRDFNEKELAKKYLNYYQHILTLN